MVDDWKNQPESTLADQEAPLNTIRALDIYKSR